MNSLTSPECLFFSFLKIITNKKTAFCIAKKAESPLS